MDATWINDTLTWIGAHPLLAGAVIFAIAFCDAVIILGALVPALPLLFAVGVLIGLGEISGPYAVASAATGAFAGDAISYWVGWRWGDRLRGIWPFSRYPQLLERGETLFRRNAAKSILIARYVGAIRPFVPAIAGIARMPFRRYAPPSAFAAVTWALLFLLPGWVLGHAYDAVAAVAGRLFVVGTLLVLVLAAAWTLVLYVYRWSAGRADAWLARMLAWSARHPVLGHYSMAAFDPARRESVPLALLALCLLAVGWAATAMVVVVVGHGEPLALDLAVHDAMLALRNPLADRPLAALASLGDWPVLVPAMLAGMGWLAWRRRWMAVLHWLAALAFGLALTRMLGATVTVVRPPGASSGFGFPSIAVTMITIQFGFFAMLIARELPGRRRVWPYLLAGTLAAAVGFARLYLGAHWLSDVIGGMLLGVAWLLVLGIAYRRRSNRPFWMKPLAWTFYGVFAVAALWYAPRNIDAKLARFEPAAPALAALDAAGWWNGDAWRTLPARRNEFDDAQRWPLDVQVAGPLAPLQARLQAAGWKTQPQAGWEQALAVLNFDTPPADTPVLPATLDTRVESLLMLHPGARPGEIHALRLWPAPASLQPGNVPLWVGSAQTLRYQRHANLIGFWSPLRDADPSLDALRAGLDGLDMREGRHPASGLPVLRLRTVAETRLAP